MHNCKATRDRLTELALDGDNCTAAEDLSADLRQCPKCDREFNALVNTMRLVNRALNMAAPSESYWPDYHATLERRLQTASVADSPREPRRNRIGDAYLAKLFSSSIVVRTPIAVAVLVLFALSLAGLAWSVRSYETVAMSSQPPTVVHVPTEVPVIQEKIVTRIVYRERERKPKQTRRFSELDPAVVSNREPANGAVDLTGFKPTNEIKLTVIKGGLRNEN